MLILTLLCASKVYCVPGAILSAFYLLISSLKQPLLLLPPLFYRWASQCTETKWLFQLWGWARNGPRMDGCLSHFAMDLLKWAEQRYRLFFISFPWFGLVLFSQCCCLHRTTLPKYPFQGHMMHYTIWHWPHLGH